MGFCQCGCGTPVKNRYVYNHHSRKSGVDYLIESRGYKTPCWVWQLALNKWGYAKTKVDGRTVAAHRYYYESYIGNIPSGFDLDHLCRVRECVNPTHLEPVTPIENKRRGDIAKLTPDQILDIIARYSKRETQSSIANHYGMSHSQIGRIIHGTRWTDIVGGLGIPSNPRCKITPDDVREIRRRCSLGESQSVVAKDYGIKACSVNGIVSRNKWKSVK